MNAVGSVFLAAATAIAACAVFCPTTAKAGSPSYEKTAGAGSSAKDDSAGLLDVRSAKVWARPDEENAILVKIAAAKQTIGHKLRLNIRTPFGIFVHESTHEVQNETIRLPVPPLEHEGGYLARVEMLQGEHVAAATEVVLSAVKNVKDDLRYGFFASFSKTSGNYEHKADMLARLHINAVEFYDYFPAHGKYAPAEPEYSFEPFGIAIKAADVQHKIAAARDRNILSLAYVAAYAASESVYRKHPHPITDARGRPKIFNGGIMTEEEADQQKRPKWFWLMNVADDSPWHDYILGEFRNALDDDQDDLLSFDGFEIDTYGDNADTRFYAKTSRRNGDLLSEVLHDFVGNVQKLTHALKPHGLVSFNSVNEFGVSNMYDVTDFLFLEIWRSHTDQLETLVDICFRHRAPKQQRVILKLYPADMDPKQTTWPPATLARILGATMTGAGSLMVAGEPDDQTGVMHGLQTLYYPDHLELSAASREVLRNYYRHDAMLLGYTHGSRVFNANHRVNAAGCITRTCSAPDKNALVIQLLHVGTEKRWSVPMQTAASQKDQQISVQLPDNAPPKAVWFCSPDSPAFQKPTSLEFKITNGTLHTTLPELQTHATVILLF